MRLNVFSQTLQEARQPLLRWTLTLAGVAWIAVLAHPLILWLFGAPALERLTAQLGLLLFGEQALSSGFQLAEWSTWVQVVVVEWVAPAMLAFFAIHMGSWLVAGEEERGSLSLLLAAPIQRYRLILEKFAVLCLLVISPALVLWFSLLLVHWSGQILLSEGFLLSAGLTLFLLGMAFGSLAMALGSFTGRRQLSEVLVLLFALVSMILSRLPHDSGLGGALRFLSPFHYYQQAVLSSLPLGSILALAAWVAVFFLLAWFAFERRDLAV